MYVLIDLDRMAVLHKHSDLHTITDLGWIECQEMPYIIYPTGDAVTLMKFTDMELKILFRNLTGEDDHNLGRPALLQVLNDIIERVPATKANPIEADMQASYVSTMIDSGKEGAWKYTKGSSRPALKADLYQPPALTADFVTAEEESALAGKLPALTPAPATVFGGTGDDRPKPTTSTPAKPSVTPKRGTAKAIIWAVADKLWEGAGKPRAKEKVLLLRKQIMDSLEKEEGIKRGSASSELGNWHKTRAPF